MKKRKKLYIISGPSGVGKGVVIAHFLQRTKNIAIAISATTRPPRKGERNNIHYYFLTKEDFKEKISQNAFLEWCLVHENYYGTLKSEVDRISSLGKDAILEIDVQGAMKIKEKHPDATLIFIAPPDYAALESRLRSRRTDSEENVNKRLSAARVEMASKSNYDYVIVNNEIDTTTQQLETIILGGQSIA